jgi:transcriptional regulator with XRE-family HTH domain
MKVNEKIKLFRTLACLKQEDLAILSCINQQYIAGIEKGRFKPTQSISRKVAQALRLDTDFLLRDDYSRIFDSVMAFYSLVNVESSSKFMKETEQTIRDLLPRFLERAKVRACNFFPELRTYVFSIPVLAGQRFEARFPELKGKTGRPLAAFAIDSHIPVFDQLIDAIIKHGKISKTDLELTGDIKEDIEQKIIMAYYTHVDKEWSAKYCSVYQRTKKTREMQTQATIVQGLAENARQVLEHYKIPLNDFLKAFHDSNVSNRLHSVSDISE